MRNPISYQSSLLLICLSLFACSGTQTTPSPATIEPTLSDIESQIAEASNQSPLVASKYYLSLAQQLMTFDKKQQALELIQRIDDNALDDEKFVIFTALAGELSLQSRAIFDAYDLLTAERLSVLWPTLTREEQMSLHRLRAETFSQLGDLQASIAERIALDTLLNDALDTIENHEILWQTLSGISLSKLKTLLAAENDAATRGWYELAIINKTYESNLDTLYRETNRWLQQNPEHPASLETPLDLQLLTTLIEQRPRKIALLLPLTGKLSSAGKAIRDGFFVAYFNQSDQSKPEVLLLDTSTRDINQVYDQAVAAGADLIIGPLQKAKVIALSFRSELPVATLALNYIPKDEGEERPEQQFTSLEAIPETARTKISSSIREIGIPFYQFGLSLEDEAIQAANRAWLENHRYAAVIASNADWSNRAADTFIEQWRAYGGTIVLDQRFGSGSNYSNTIKTALNINQSENRARRLRRLFGQALKFEPRRRQDIDMIFLVTRSSDGRQIKPTLSFYYAGNIPVYATSQIYSSNQDSGKNLDLNGIRFTTLPWILEPENIEKQLISQSINIPPSYERLYALGVDAFSLHNRLKQLKRSEKSFVSGKTGKLYLDRQQRVVRQQPWAEIVRGVAKPLPPLTQRANDT
ncbi:MAG: outer membrane PBP1 activator LpoA protein [Cellvibrionaceae bacterium]|jgi:outer membrane PBP1 activator LpoA protein